jgi:hypothetical protein
MGHLSHLSHLDSIKLPELRKFSEIIQDVVRTHLQHIVPYETVEKELLKHTDYDNIDRIISLLKQNGELFEPKPGFLAMLE